MAFHALFISLPTKGGTDRVRVWRSLKALGCATLRDGVYLLPHTPENGQALEAVALEVRAADGSADVHVLAGRDPDHTEALARLFDRTAEYAELADDARRLLAEIESLDAAAAARREQALARRFEQLARIDFYPGEPLQQVASLLADLRRAVAAKVSPDEPSPRAGSVPVLDIAAYRGRTWATRARPKIDRLASAWLIKRRIDPRSRFVWLDRPKDCPRDALGFDFDGAAFSHVGPRVTFETLLASFRLDADAALARIGALVHFLDVGGIPVAEAAGIEALIDGALASQPDDDALLRQMLPVFDWLHVRYAAEAPTR